LQQGTDGIKTGQLVRSDHNVPVIYIAEFAAQTTLRQAKSTGPFGYIFIPFTDRQIFSTLDIAILRIQFEKEIQEGQKWLTGVLNGIADGVIAINDRGQIRYINQVALALTGWLQEDAISRDVHDVIKLVDEGTKSIDLRAMAIPYNIRQLHFEVCDYTNGKETPSSEYNHDCRRQCQATWSCHSRCKEAARNLA
jgi:PAS domain-containing protein